MKKLFKKLLCFALATTLVLGCSLTAFADEEENIRDPYTIEGQYVQELVDFSAEKITALPLSEAKTLFKKAFTVSADNYSEDEIRLGWDWYRSFDRDNMNTCFQRMDQNNQLMKVQFMWSGNMVNKIYTTVTKSTTMSNPFPGTYGDWHVDQYGYLYNY